MFSSFAALFYIGQVLFKCTHAGVYPNGIIIEDNEDVRIGHAKMVETFKGHSTRN